MSVRTKITANRPAESWVRTWVREIDWLRFRTREHAELIRAGERISQVEIDSVQDDLAHAERELARLGYRR